MERQNILTISLNLPCNCNTSYYSYNIRANWKKENLKKILKAAYSVGFSTFQLIGAEKNNTEYLPQIIQYIMSLGNDTRLILNISLYNLERLLGLLEIYKKRIEITVNVDFSDKYMLKIHSSHHLSEKAKRLAKEILKREITSFFNIISDKELYFEILPFIKGIKKLVKIKHVSPPKSKKELIFEDETCEYCHFEKECYSNALGPIIYVGQVLNIVGLDNPLFCIDLNNKSEDYIRTSFFKILRLYRENQTNNIMISVS